MAAGNGPETPEEVAVMLTEIDAEVRQEADPDWYAKYGKNLASYSAWLFAGDKPDIQ